MFSCRRDRNPPTIVHKRARAWQDVHTRAHLLVFLIIFVMENLFEIDRGNVVEVDRLTQQIGFIIEIDKLKQIIRQSYLMDTARRENSAEHSWHLAMMAILLAEHANEPVDLLRVLKTVLIHDIVEIDAGDIYCYDEQGILQKAQLEQAAAARLFGMLPPDQAHELRRLWEEFETGATPEARFAAALDRLMPLMHNYYTQGKSWREHGITRERVLVRNGPIRDGSLPLWELAQGLIDDAVLQGYLAAAPDPAPDTAA